ncbi:MAG: GNAT family N-acetyltransferase [Gammaproteobacteria bacterium]|nr:MAG: GNAT family N-acetyltransferase [Gammaproteobacteria bacterium]
MTVRLANESDCPEIYRVQMAAVRSLPPGVQGEDGVETWLATRTPELYAQKMQTEVYVVAEDAARVVGWGALNVAGEEITNVFVDPAHHRKRVGTAVITKLEAAARDGGLEAVQLRATGTAIEFYLAVGYQSDPPVEPGAKWALMKKLL